MSATTESKKLNPTEAAIVARRSEKTIRTWIRRGLLKANRDPLNGRLEIDEADLEKLLRREPAVAPQPAA